MNDIVTGTDALRAAVAARATKTNFAPLARDLGISSEALHGFSTGQTSLPPDVLKALASQLWGGHVEFTEPRPGVVAGSLAALEDLRPGHTGAPPPQAAAAAPRVGRGALSLRGDGRLMVADKSAPQITRTIRCLQLRGQ